MKTLQVQVHDDADIEQFLQKIIERKQRNDSPADVVLRQDEADDLLAKATGCDVPAKLLQMKENFLKDARMNLVLSLWLQAAIAQFNYPFQDSQDATDAEAIEAANTYNKKYNAGDVVMITAAERDTICYGEFQSGYAYGYVKGLDHDTHTHTHIHTETSTRRPATAAGLYYYKQLQVYKHLTYLAIFSYNH